MRKGLFATVAIIALSIIIGGVATGGAFDYQNSP